MTEPYWSIEVPQLEVLDTTEPYWSREVPQLEVLETTASLFFQLLCRQEVCCSIPDHFLMIISSIYTVLLSITLLNCIKYSSRVPSIL